MNRRRSDSIARCTSFSSAGRRWTSSTTIGVRGGSVANSAANAAGWEAIESAVRLNPDVILLDFHLPDIDGLECLRVLRRQRGPHPPVILFSADWDVEDHTAEAHAVGATIMSKLADATEVERVLASLCTMHRSAEPEETDDRWSFR